MIQGVKANDLLALPQQKMSVAMDFSAALADATKRSDNEPAPGSLKKPGQVRRPGDRQGRDSGEGQQGSQTSRKDATQNNDSGRRSESVVKARGADRDMNRQDNQPVRSNEKIAHDVDRTQIGPKRDEAREARVLGKRVQRHSGSETKVTEQGRMPSEEVARRANRPQDRARQGLVKEIRNHLPGTDEKLLADTSTGPKEKSVKLAEIVNSKSLEERAGAEPELDAALPLTDDIPEVADFAQLAAQAKVTKGSAVTGKNTNVSVINRLSNDVIKHAAKLKSAQVQQLAKQAFERFEAALKQVDQGQAVVRLVDRELGAVEANIVLAGNDLKIRMRAEDAAMRQGLGDLIVEIEKELKAAKLVSGDVDVKKEDEGANPEGRDSDHSDPQQGTYDDGTELRSRLAKLA